MQLILPRGPLFQAGHLSSSPCVHPHPTSVYSHATGSVLPLNPNPGQFTSLLSSEPSNHGSQFRSEWKPKPAQGPTSPYTTCQSRRCFRDVMTPPFPLAHLTPAPRAPCHPAGTAGMLLAAFRLSPLPPLMLCFSLHVTRSLPTFPFHCSGITLSANSFLTFLFKTATLTLHPPAPNSPYVLGIIFSCSASRLLTYNFINFVIMSVAYCF